MTTLKNFIDSAGGHSNSEVWQQISTINSIDIQPNPSDASQTEGRVTVSVANKDQFLAALGGNGYDVDREQADAGSTHNNPYTPSQLLQELKKNGTVPRCEP